MSRSRPRAATGRAPRARLALEALEARETPAVADLGIQITDGLEVASTTSIDYVITVTNTGPEPATAATISSGNGGSFVWRQWTAQGLNGATVSQSTGNFFLTLTADIPVGGVVRIDALLWNVAKTGNRLFNTASVSPGPGDSDPDPSDNTATDFTYFTPGTLTNYWDVVGAGPGGGACSGSPERGHGWLT